MLKRCIDIVVSGLILLFLAVPFCIIILVLKLTGEHEAFYLQDRVGLGGRIIKVTKFATMLKASPQIGTQDITLRNDPRVLPAGRFLRKTKLNELPQFWDVFVGRLSLVGWRPLMPQGFADYPEDVQQAIVKIKPGLTGIGSLVFRDEEAIIARAADESRDLRTCYRQDIMPFKGALEVWYVKNKGLLTDFKILVATAVAVLSPGWRGYSRWFSGLPVPASKLILRHFEMTETSGTQGNSIAGNNEPPAQSSSESGVR
jgi:lipopolysaccharide/colanic/teichoic acid biosynthesis glycosyltransferase